MAVQCWPSVQRLMGISVCALYGRLTDHDVLTACETDVLGALSMLANHPAALGEIAALYRLDHPAPREPQPAAGLALRQRPRFAGRDDGRRRCARAWT